MEKAVKIAQAACYNGRHGKGTNSLGIKYKKVIKIRGIVRFQICKFI